VCRPPTVSTIVVLVALYQKELRALEEAASRFGARIFEPGVVADLIPIFARDAVRAGRLLRTCVRHGAWGELEERIHADDALAPALMITVLEMCDIGRIVEAFTRPLPPPMPGKSPVDLTETGMILILARQYGLDPRAVMEWPYELLLDVIDEMEHQTRGQTKELDGSAGGAASDDAIRGIPGVAYTG
jgi:hypothetical protein